MPTSATPLAGKVALITGSSRGLGKEAAIELASRGADVVINYVSSPERAQEVVDTITGMGRKAIAIQADVSVPTQIASLFEQAMKYFGKLDIVYSNSGREHFGKVTDVTEEDFDRIFSVNTRGQFFVAKEAYKHISNGGRLILTSSISVQSRSVKNHAVYAGSKSAVEAFTRCFAADFGEKGVTVNALAPGGVKSDMYEEASRNYIPGALGGPNGEGRWTIEQVDAKLASMSPLGRVGIPSDVSKVVAFLCSEDADWINGQVITIGGGASI